MNWYEYCGGNPVNFVDPFGLFLGKTGGKDREAAPAPSGGGSGKNNGGGKGTGGKEGRQPKAPNVGKNPGYKDKVKTDSWEAKEWESNNGPGSTVDLGNGETERYYTGDKSKSEDDANNEKSVADDAKETISLGGGGSPKSPNDDGKPDDKGNGSPEKFSPNGGKDVFGKIKESAKDWWDEVGNWDYVSGQIDYCLNCPLLGEVNLGFLAGTKAIMFFGRFGDDAVRAISKTKIVTKLLESPKMAKHHIFPQQFKNLFKSKGINIDDFTVSVPQNTTHLKGLHGKGFNNLPGQWNARWSDFIKNNPNATAKDFYQFGGKLMDEYGLSGLTINSY